MHGHDARGPRAHSLWPCKTCLLLVAVGDTTPREVIGRYLYDDPVPRQDPYVVHANLTRDGTEDCLAVFELHVEHRVGERFHDLTLKLDSIRLSHLTYFLLLTAATIYHT